MPLARELADAPSAALRTFLAANESGALAIKPLCALALAVAIPPLVIAAALRVELSENRRGFLMLQLYRLDALAGALLCVEQRITRDARSSPPAWRTGT